MSCFFDTIGIADMEKVHSAIIGWMLSDNNEVFDKKCRSTMLQKIFKVPDSDLVEEFESVDSHIELSNIDILIETKHEGKVQFWIIENKIKSSQHSNQLDRYAKYLDDNQSFKESIKAFCFLTLVNEAPKTAGCVQWICTNYFELKDILNIALEQTKDRSNDYYILIEYKKCIEELSNTVKWFLENHTKCQNVFTEGKYKKEAKIKHQGLEEKQQYIRENGLETIFQKCFLSMIIPNTKFNDIPNVNISETHGTAFVDFMAGIIGEVAFQIQFQDGTFKIQVIGNKNTNVEHFFTNWGGKLKSLKESNSNFQDWTINKSKGEKKPYISLSKKYDAYWYKKGLFTIIANWNNAYDACTEMITKLKESLTNE